MATTQQEQERERHAKDRDTKNRDEQGAKQTMQETYREKLQREADDFERTDKALYEQATRGIIDEDMRDKVLALGGDATRSSPSPSQPLDDIMPGITTTTGAHRTPIDPTTAAVPAPANSEQTMRMRGFPTVGSGETGTAEELWRRPERRDFMPEASEK